MVLLSGLYGLTFRKQVVMRRSELRNIHVVCFLVYSSMCAWRNILCPIAEAFGGQCVESRAFQLNSLFAMRLIKKYYFCNNTECLFR